MVITLAMVLLAMVGTVAYDDENVADVVAALLTPTARSESVFEIYALPPISQEHYDHEWSLQDAEFATRVRWLADGRRLRIDEQDSFDLRGEGVPPKIVAWNGTAWMGRTGRSFVYSSRPRRHSADCGALFNGTTSPTLIGARGTLVESIRNGEPVDTVRTKQELLHRWRDGGAEIFLQVDLAKGAITRYEVSRFPEPVDRPSTVWRYYVVSWEEQDGVWLPKVAVREAESTRATDERMVTRHVYLRHSWRMREPGDELERDLLVPLDAGDMVFDVDRNLRWRAGESRIRAQGEEFEVSEPIWRTPDAALLELSERGLWPSAGETETDEGPGPDHGRAFILIGVVTTLVFGLLAWRSRASVTSH